MCRTQPWTFGVTGRYVFSARRQAPGLEGGHCLPRCARLFLPAVGAVGMCFLFSKTEACGLPAPLEMEVNSTNNPTPRAHQRWRRPAPSCLRCGPGGASGWGWPALRSLTLLSTASLFLPRSGQSHPPAQGRGGQDPAQALPESAVCPEEASHRRRCSFSI